MTPQELAEYLARIREARSVELLNAIAHEAVEMHGGDEAVPRIALMCKAKAERLASKN